MLNRILLVLMLLAVPAFCADEAKAIENAERGWAKGVTSNDFALLEQVLANDLTYTHSNGAVDTKASYIGNLKSGKSRYVKIEYGDLKVQQLSKETAITINRAGVTTLVDGKENPMKMTFLHVFKKNGKQWQLVAHQSARLAQ